MRVAVAALTVVLAGRAWGQFSAQSNFDHDAEGWRGDTCNGGFSWQGSGGNPDGYLRWAEPCSATFVVAPIQYLGNWSSLDHVGAIDYDFRIDHWPGNGQSLPYEVRLSGPFGLARWVGSAPSSTHGWRHFHIPIEVSQWQVVSGDWFGILAAMGRFEIRVRQFTNTDSSEQIGLDSVRVGVVPEPTGLSILAGGLLVLARRRHRR